MVFKFNRCNRIYLSKLIEINCFLHIENYPNDIPPLSNSILWTILIELTSVFMLLKLAPVTRKLLISNGSPSSSTFGSCSLIWFSSIDFCIQNFFRLCKFKTRTSFSAPIFKRKKFLSNMIDSIEKNCTSVGKIDHSSTNFLPVARSKIFSWSEIYGKSFTFIAYQV